MKRIKSLKLSIKLILIMVFTCVVLLISEILGRKGVYEAYDEQLYIRTSQVCIAYANQIEAKIEDMSNVTLSVIGDTELQEMLMRLKSAGENKDYKDIKETEGLLRVHNSFYGYNTRFSIILPDGDIISPYKQETVLQQYISQAYENKGRIGVFTHDNCLSVYRQIRQIAGLTMDNLGVLFMQVDLGSLMNSVEYSYEKIEVNPNISIYDQGNCIYTSVLKLEDVPPFIEKPEMINDQFVVPCTSSKLGWVFVISIPYRDINESIRYADYKATLTCIIIAMLVCLISVTFVYSLMPHINLLMKKFELFRKGEIFVPESYPSYEGRDDEFGRLHQQFDKMAVEYQKLTEESYQNMVLLKEAQFQQLQQQIHPHFLFNTLSAIVWNAAENNDMETARMADALGKILRSSFQNTGSLVTVEDEIKIVRDYLYIQELRYGDRLRVEESIDEVILNARIPSFSLQPIVENVIVHVVEKKIEPCLITIAGRSLVDEVEIVIEDDNGDLDEDILEKLNRKEISPKGSGVGLGNVDARIKLAFSSEYGLCVSSENGCSRVIIRIPYTTV